MNAEIRPAEIRRQILNREIRQIRERGFFVGQWSVDLWSRELGVCNVCHALKTRYTCYSVDGQ